MFTRTRSTSRRWNYPNAPGCGTERRNRELEMENAFLKKASAYFAREQR